MSRKLFGTDGIRGKTNCFPMTPEVAMRIGMAAGRYFVRGDHQHRVVIGKDTRLSGYMIESALTAGFTAVGMDVVMVGPMPTPAIAMLVRSLRADLGVMISASHNPFEDNGIKLFGPDGYKLSDDVELEIENLLNGDLEGILTAPGDLGRARRLDDAKGRYIEFAKSTFPQHLRLDGLKVVIDCANGAAYNVAPTVLWELGAEVEVVGVRPNGTNINDGCGSTAPETMCRTVVEKGAHLGLALDGDADRLLLADEKGNLIDGDQLMALIGTSWAASQRLRGDGVVATIMSNLAFERYLMDQGLTVERTKVGDRYVVECMRLKGYNVGGEQSGHIIMNDFTTTGDGLIAALQVMAVIVASDRPPSETCRLFEPYPQLLKNARYEDGDPLALPQVKEAIADYERRLGNQGRLVIRKSGTEPVIRVMAEGEDERLISKIVDDLVATVERAA